MEKKILVTYASRSGSTASIANEIGMTLAQLGRDVDVIPMRDIDDLAPYQAVVAGSAIQGGKWLPEAMQFIRKNRLALQQRPFAAFLVCITLGLPNSEKYRQGIATWLAPVRILVRPVCEGYFAGSLDFSKISLSFNSVLLRLAVALGALPKGDHRDMKKVYDWTCGLAAQLKEEKSDESYDRL